MAHVIKEIVVDAPVEQVYDFWQNFENFPRFMDNIESIQKTGPDTTHWKSRGPMGMAVEWDAKTISVQENQKIAWQSVDGNIETHGAVTFEPIGTDQTKVTVGLEYSPPAGALGEAVAKMFANPESQLEEDLERFKVVAEREGFAAQAVGNPTVPDGSYVQTVHSDQRPDVDGVVRGSGAS